MARFIKVTHIYIDLPVYINVEHISRVGLVTKEKNRESSGIVTGIMMLPARGYEDFLKVKESVEEVMILIGSSK